MVSKAVLKSELIRRAYFAFVELVIFVNLYVYWSQPCRVEIEKIFRL